VKISVRQLERFLVGACAFLMIILYCQLFFRSCGGPFPERLRGPFAKESYTRLGDLPEDERDYVPNVELPAK